MTSVLSVNAFLCLSLKKEKPAKSSTVSLEWKGSGSERPCCSYPKGFTGLYMLGLCGSAIFTALEYSELVTFAVNMSFVVAGAPGAIVWYS